MSGSCGFVRPYPGRLGTRVREFVTAAGFVVGPNSVLPQGASDERAARWILRNHFDLLVVPFHLHRGESGEVLDGVGVLLNLPQIELLRRTTFFMPVRKFSFHASFQRRLEVLEERRPDLLPWLVAVHQDELERHVVLTRLRRIQEARRRQTAGTTILPPAPLDGEEAPAFELWRQADWSSAGRPSDARAEKLRSSWPARAPSEAAVAESSVPLASPVGVTEDPQARNTSGMFFRAKSHRSGIPPSARVAGALSSRVRTDIENARDSFRRATEIGAQARKDFEEAKKARRRRR